MGSCSKTLARLVLLAAHGADLKWSIILAILSVVVLLHISEDLHLADLKPSAKRCS
jgi:hypothetical protein